MTPAHALRRRLAIADIREADRRHRYWLAEQAVHPALLWFAQDGSDEAFAAAEAAVAEVERLAGVEP
jgi:hypothetical protein